MYVAKDVNGNKVNIKDAINGEKYFCECCNKEVIQRKGKVKEWYFCHKSEDIKEKSKKNIQWRKNWQSLFPETNIKVTKNDETKILDARLNNLALRFQNTSLTGEEFINYSEFFSNDYNLVWIFNVHDKEIIKHKKKDNIYYQWKFPHRFGNIQMHKTNFHLALELDRDKFILVTWNTKDNGFKYFKGYEVDRSILYCYLVILSNHPVNNILINENKNRYLYPILELYKEHFFLNKYDHDHPFTYNGLTFNNVEAAYNSRRNDSVAHEYCNLNGSAALRKGLNEKFTRADWDTKRVEFIIEALFAKFTQHPQLKEKLLATGNTLIINGNKYCDNELGYCICEKCKDKSKLNLYGKALMHVRKTLRELDDELCGKVSK